MATSYSKRTDYNRYNNDDRHGLIILGNSGVGKSFLANVLLGRDAFVHEFSSGSVTHITESQEIDLLYDNLAIFNIPGLIEAEQKRIDLNKKEIDKAFAQRPNSIVMFVFGQQGGRIREEDIVAFNAINAAYPFKPQSLVLVVNGLPRERPSKYEGTTLVLLQQLLKNVSVNNRNLCFLNQIDANDVNARRRLREQLLQMIVEFRPSLHEKQQEIITVLDELKRERMKIREQRDQFEADRMKYMKQINEGQRVLDETVANHRSETESLKRAVQLYDERFIEQQRRFEEENRTYKTQLQGLQEQMNQAQRSYDKIRQDHAGSLEEIQASRERHRQLENAYQTLLNQPPPPPLPQRKPRWYETAIDFLQKVIPVINQIPWSSFTGGSNR